MIFIKDNEGLRQFIPNSLREAQGERSYFEKLKSFLERVEDWLIDEVIDPDYVEDAAADKPLNDLICTYIFSKAYADAIPSLDLVLTPNGFGVVSNQNIAPASKDRVRAARDSYLSIADSTLDRIICGLLRYSVWRNTDRGMWFTRSLFTHPSSVSVYCPFDKFKEFREKAEVVEWQLADKAISHPLFDALIGIQAEAWSSDQCWLVDRIRSYVKEALAEKPNQDSLYDRMIYMVEAIRRNPIAFPQWQDTPTARQWDPPVFVNRKSSSGYWF